MEAKDTVKKVNLDDYDNKRCHWKVDEMLAEQAEITWDKAIREAGGFIEFLSKNYSNTEWGNTKFREALQAKLEEWGIK